jgi:hypothetical protein
MYELIGFLIIIAVLFLFAGAHQEIMHKRDEAAKRHAINEENLVHLYQFAKIVAHDCSDDFTRLNARAVIETVQERAKDDQQAVALV